MKLLSVGSALLSGVLLLQAPSTPPIKMGLWELTVTTHMANPPANMPGMGNQTMHIRSCYTLEKYREEVLNQRKGCTRTNEVWTSHSFSADVACGSVSGHFSMTFDSRESFSTSTTLIGQSQGRPPIHIDSTGSGRFLAADCGSVTPEHPQIDMH